MPNSLLAAQSPRALPRCPANQWSSIVANEWRVADSWSKGGSPSGDETAAVSGDFASVRKPIFGPLTKPDFGPLDAHVMRHFPATHAFIYLLIYSYASRKAPWQHRCCSHTVQRDSCRSWCLDMVGSWSSLESAVVPHTCRPRHLRPVCLLHLPHIIQPMRQPMCPLACPLACQLTCPLMHPQPPRQPLRQSRLLLSQQEGRLPCQVRHLPEHLHPRPHRSLLMCRPLALLLQIVMTVYTAVSRRTSTAEERRVHAAVQARSAP
jgi:hypothetical protein